MKDDNDRHTGTLDGIEPEPVKLTQAQRMQRMGYKGPKERHRCETCRHVQERVHFPDSIAEFTRHWCGLGEFRVHRGSFCCDYRPAKPKA